MFSSGNEEPRNQLKSSIFKNADQSNLGRSLIEGNNYHLLSQARSELVRQQRLELQDAKHGYVESRREQVRLQEDNSTKEQVFRDTQIRSMHKMGDMKRAQELRVQAVMIPNSRSMLSRDKRLPLDTGNTSGLQENVFGYQFSTFDSHRDHPQGIHPLHTTNRTRISSTSCRDRDSFARDMEEVVFKQESPSQRHLSASHLSHQFISGVPCRARPVASGREAGGNGAVPNFGRSQCHASFFCKLNMLLSCWCFGMGAFLQLLRGRLGDWLCLSASAS